MIEYTRKIRAADRLKHIENTEISEAVVKTLVKINSVLDNYADNPSVPLILIECIEYLSMGAGLTTDLNLSAELA